MSISKKIRFEVFKRDGFTCQYCGKHPPEVILEVDHINPKSKGGQDDINNLLTSCFDCNRGKSNIELKQVTHSMIDNMEAIKEREKQYVEYHKLLAKVQRRINSEIKQVTEIYEGKFKGWTLTDTFKKGTVKQFIEKLNVFEVEEAMSIAVEKCNKDASLKYFCGICWNKIRNNG
jgi:hypothetical protein